MSEAGTGGTGAEHPEVLTTITYNGESHLPLHTVHWVRGVPQPVKSVPVCDPDIEPIEVTTYAGIIYKPGPVAEYDLGPGFCAECAVRVLAHRKANDEIKRALNHVVPSGTKYPISSSPDLLFDEPVTPPAYDAGVE